MVVEDNLGDVRLIVEAFKEAPLSYNLAVAGDGLKAMRILNGECKSSQRPKLIILDLNIPKKIGLEVLKEIKNDEKLKHIPVIILTTSKSPQDIEKSYKNHANAYIAKPINFEEFKKIVKSIQNYWTQTTKLP